jgi:GTPase Era involved in 16S rRNA processing
VLKPLCFYFIPGVGKSTLINSLRQLKATDPGAAATNEAEECTALSMKYMLCDTPIALWDLPGCGTTKHPTASYCQDRCLDLFDLIIICYHKRFVEGADAIVRCAEKNDIPLIVLYTQTDTSVSNIIQSGRADTAAEAFQNLRLSAESNVREHLFAAGVAAHINVPVFFVNSHSFRLGNAQFDENKLLELIVRSTALRHPDRMTEDELWERVRKAAAPAGP